MTERRSLLALKLALTLPVAAAMLYPFATPEGRAGVLASLTALGIWNFTAILTAFLVAIAFYCMMLQRLISRAAPENRAMRPGAVWLMFVPFYNIVEDFFIIRGVNETLRREGAANPALAGVKSFGALPGYGWCTAQVLALVPNRIGEAAALVALALWLWHWAQIWNILKRMDQER
ncbi:MAG: hypothetical protein LCH38_10135 [Proteobacteria bacterium]|nr:hypothetical protein [Pseudomonadota bacterium]